MNKEKIKSDIKEWLEIMAIVLCSGAVVIHINSLFKPSDNAGPNNDDKTPAIKKAEKDASALRDSVVMISASKKTR